MNVVWLAPFMAVMLTSVLLSSSIVMEISLPLPPFATFQLRQYPVASTLLLVLTTRSYFFGREADSWKTYMQDFPPQNAKGSLLSHSVPGLGISSMPPQTGPRAIVP